ncbi:MAG: hypothetical protein WKF79_04545 [Nocardioides sp.]
MKLTRRRSTVAATEERAPAEPTPPRGSPMSAFVGILDGQSLWLAIEAMPGSLALRDATTGDVLALPGDVAEDQPAYRSLRLDLGGLPGTEEAAYDVVLVPSGGRAPKPVWAEPLTGGRPPPAADGETQWTLSRTDDGFLQVRRERLAPAVWLAGVEELADGVRLTVTGDAAALTLVVDGESLATYPTTASTPGTVSAVITADGVDPGVDVLTRILADDLPVRRQRNDLADPARGVPLPTVAVPGTDDVRLRLRFGGEAYLMARILKRDIT